MRRRVAYVGSNDEQERRGKGSPGEGEAARGGVPNARVRRGRVPDEGGRNPFTDGPAGLASGGAVGRVPEVRAQNELSRDGAGLMSDEAIRILRRIDRRIEEQERSSRRKLTDLPDNTALLCGSCGEVLGWQHDRSRIVRNRCGRGDRVVRIRPIPGHTFSQGCDRCQAETPFLEPHREGAGRWNLESPRAEPPEVEKAKKEHALQQLGIVSGEVSRMLAEIGADAPKAFRALVAEIEATSGIQRD